MASNTWLSNSIDVVGGVTNDRDDRRSSEEKWSPEMQTRLDQLTRYFYSVAAGEPNAVDQATHDMDEIIPGLYVGNGKVATEIERLKQCGITHVLNLRRRSDWVAMVDYEENGILFAHVPMADALCFDMKRNVNAAIAFIDMALSHDGKVLVHCNAGRSRSPTVVAAYLIAMKQHDAFSASSELVKQRPQVFPNETFLRFLCELDEKVRSSPYRPNLDDILPSCGDCDITEL